jgi:D-alanyl-D-alanine dipeptidase
LRPGDLARTMLRVILHAGPPPRRLLAALAALALSAGGAPRLRAQAAGRRGDAASMADLTGRWRGRHSALDLEVRDGVLWMTPLAGGTVGPLGARRDTLVSRMSPEGSERLLRRPGFLVYRDDTLRPIPDREPPPPPAADVGLIGAYGRAGGEIHVLERDGTLYALTDSFALAPLRRVAPGVYRFAGAGPHAGAPLSFALDAAGRATSIVIGSVALPRRPIGPEGGAPFRITPLRPVEELRRAALAMRPPPAGPGARRPDLVDLAALDSAIRLDIRYATSDDFLGTPMYSSARAFLQRPAAQALLRALRRLERRGYGVLIYDAYRPWYVTRMFWDATPDSLKAFVADPRTGSNHNRGCAVDLTLYDLGTGRPVDMGGGYDEFSPRSHAFYPALTDAQRWHRALLRRAMEAQGFRVYDAEWWHFDYRDWARYPVLNLTFEQLAPRHDH